MEMPSPGALYMEQDIKWPDYDGSNESLHFDPEPTWSNDVEAIRAFRKTESGGVYNYRNKVLMGMAQTRVLNYPPEVTAKEDVDFTIPTDVVRPDTDEEILMMSVLEMQGLLRTGQLTSVELTEISLAMLDKYDPEFNMLEVALKDLAMEKANMADEMFAAGEYVSAIQGIPFAIKVLYSTCRSFGFLFYEAINSLVLLLTPLRTHTMWRGTPLPTVRGSFSRTLCKLSHLL